MKHYKTALIRSFTYSTQFQPLYIPNALHTKTQFVPRSKHTPSRL